ncbi:MAG: putative molybdenum carrier protein [Verrucomicrobia bacterium]|nr:putative molybdenum carrier protein [Verrucomicrobiota bacterium]MCH8527881.1 putative molybdenum carrier protein [Kiritimatiellia bacterium]
MNAHNINQIEKTDVDRIKIISGGQTGADRGGLDAAIALGIPHGGYCPRGRKAEDGPIPEYYQLTELPSPSYLVRTEKNVKESDCTLLFTMGPPTGGSKRTLQFAQKHGKPAFAIDLRKPIGESLHGILKWLKTGLTASNVPVILNVAGSRESKSPGLSLITYRVIIIILKASTE